MRWTRGGGGSSDAWLPAKKMALLIFREDEPERERGREGGGGREGKREGGREGERERNKHRETDTHRDIKFDSKALTKCSQPLTHVHHTHYTYSVL